jgi:hypothetical protein
MWADDITKKRLCEKFFLVSPGGEFHYFRQAGLVLCHGWDSQSTTEAPNETGMSIN